MRKADLSKDLSQVMLVGDIYHCWIVEFNGIMQPVLFMITFLLILSPLKEAICMKDVGYCQTPDLVRRTRS